MLSDQVYDVIDATRARLAEAGVRSADEVRQRPPLVTFSETMRADSRHLKAFLFRNLYRHPQVVETTGRARRVVSELFAAYMAQPGELPEAYARQPQRAGRWPTTSPYKCQSPAGIKDLIIYSKIGILNRFLFEQFDNQTLNCSQGRLSESLLKKFRF